MKKIHLLWIIPIILIVGLVIGYVGIESIMLLDNTLNSIDKCNVQTLKYATEHNTDCGILITGYLRNCTQLAR
jgi:hypothetical protein